MRSYAVRYLGWAPLTRPFPPPKVKRLFPGSVTSNRVEDCAVNRRLLVMGAGSGATNNLVRSLRRGDPSLHIAGCHHDRFTLKQSTTDQTYLLPRVDHSAFFPSLHAVLKRERIELVIPNSDADVRTLAERRDEFEGRLFLPGINTIALCQDKYELTALLSAQGRVRSFDSRGYLARRGARHLRAFQPSGARLVSTPCRSRRNGRHARAHSEPGHLLDAVLGAIARHLPDLVHAVRIPTGARFRMSGALRERPARPHQELRTTDPSGSWRSPGWRLVVGCPFQDRVRPERRRGLRGRGSGHRPRRLRSLLFRREGGREGSSVPDRD